MAGSPRWRRVRNDTSVTAMDRYLNAYSVAFPGAVTETTNACSA